MPRQFKAQEAIEASGFYPLFTAFQEYSKVQHYSKDTLRRHRSSLKRFIAWCCDHELYDPQQITKDHLDAYKHDLFYYRQDNGKPLSPNSQGVILTPLKTFFDWMSKKQVVVNNPASELEIPKKIRRLPPPILRHDDIEKVLAQPDIKTDQGVRDRTIMEVLYSTGIRRGECTRLMIYDVDLLHQTCRINDGKGHQDRLIPVGARAIGWVNRYLQFVRPNLVRYEDPNSLFLSDQGKAFHRSALAWRVKQYLIKAGISVKGACHLFRHSMATQMLENGADIRYIQAILGHKDLNSTQIYTRVSISKLSEVHAATHPARTSVAA